MGTLDDHVQVVWIDMQIMLLSIHSDGFSDLVLHFRRNSMFGCIHVRDLGPTKSLRELVPGLGLDIVIFPDVKTPDLASRGLQNLDQM